MSDRIAIREEYASVLGLRDRGIPLDEFEIEHMSAACRGLQIFEDKDIVWPSIALNLPSGQSGYVLNVVIANDSARPLSPAHIGFECPAWESRMSLLPDPRKEHRKETFRNSRKNRGAYLQQMASRNVYEFPQTTVDGYERDAVVNHQIGPTRRVYSGEPLEGLLMVVGENSIPWNYRDRDRFELRLAVYDQSGHSSWGRFELMVQRTAKEKELIEKFAKLNEKRSRKKRAVAAD